MRKNLWTARLLAYLLSVFTVFTVTVLAAGAGSQEDPLVTLSYLNDTFLPDALKQVDEKLASRNEALSKQLDEQIKAGLQAVEGTGSAQTTAPGDTQAFSVVTLSKGQTLTGKVGCEVMLRVGTATCVSSSSPGLIDETDGSTLGGGKALVKNHLYMMTIDGRGVKAGAASTKVLVRGDYTIK